MDTQHYLESTNLYAKINKRAMDDPLIEPAEPHLTEPIIVGKSGCLFERGYIDDYYGFTEPYNSYRPEGLQETVNHLEYIQKALEKRGIGSVFFLSTSKGSQCARYIPDWFIKMNQTPEHYVRAYDAILPMLKASSLNWFDAKELLEEKGLYVTYPKTGIHWNKLAAFEAACEVVRKLEKQSGKTLRHMQAPTFTTSTGPAPYSSSETDIFGILNAAHPGAATLLDGEYYWPNVEVSNPEEKRCRILFQGGSFCHDLYHWYNEHVADCRFIYYNWIFYWATYPGCDDKADNPLGNAGDDAWEKLLDGIDFVVFEATEQQIATLGWDSVGHSQMYKSLYRYLKKKESKQREYKL